MVCLIPGRVGGTVSARLSAGLKTYYKLALMDILLAISDSQRGKELKDSLSGKDYEVVSCTDKQSVAGLLDDEEIPDIIVLDEDLLGPDLLKSCRELASKVDPDRVQMMVLAGEQTIADALLFPKFASCDFLVSPCDVNVFEKKIGLLAKRVLENQLELETKMVMDRYIRYIETLAAERRDQLIHLDCLSTVGIMVASMIHEINNALGCVIASIGTIEKYIQSCMPLIKKAAAKESDGSPIKRAHDRLPTSFERLKRALTRLRAIVKGSHHFAKPGENSKRLHVVEECIAEAIEVCTNGLGCKVKVQTEFESEETKLFINPAQLVQVLVNIIMNAYQAMDGQVDPIITVGTKIEEGRFVIHIDDQGPGIPESDLDKIWAAFYTTKAKGKGTGLGLAICREIILGHNGTLTACNIDGGARFSLSLPMTNQ